MRFRKINEMNINKRTKLKWFYDKETDQYKVTVCVYNREIYNRVLDRKHYGIYKYYIEERIKYLIGEGIIDKEYTMILLDGTMYKVIDNFHFMELLRALVPVDSVELYEFKDCLFDIVMGSSLRTGEVFGETDLVFHNGAFYNDGNRIKDIRDFERDGIEYNYYDLLNGINEEQLSYLVWDYYSRDFENYITRDVNLKIDRWY